jgi:MATE family multidrug resistance protein
MARAVAATDWDVEVARAKELTKPTTSTNHAECNTNASNSSVATSTKTAISSTGSNAGGKSNNGYVPISEGGRDDDTLQKLEEGLMTMAPSSGGASGVSGSNGDTNAVDRDSRRSSSSSSGAVCTAVEEKDQRKDEVPERAPLIRVGDEEEEEEKAHDGDGDGRGGG